jgi:phage replication-related protein YjqB (UPF0714/DUF867 family)
VPDTYSNYALLSAEQADGVDFRRELRRTGSIVSHIAVHGGGIEAGTTEAADAVAALNGQSYYSFVGLKLRSNNVLHVTSTHFDEPECIALQESVLHTVSYHGCAGTGCTIHMGGTDRELGQSIGWSLQSAGFVVDWQPVEDRNGSAVRNICNRTISGMGVQLELSAGLRQAFFPAADISRAMRESGQRTETFRRFVTAVAAVTARLDAPQ